ncbi:MAG: NFACT family protein [Eubacterium sp.]|nr:NFACT family protein [Eubacterium sp.]
MALDGIVVSNLTKDLKDKLTGARISKIAQPEKDALLLTFKSKTDGTQRLYLSASPSLPLVYFVQENKPSPMTAPNFCMLLRKHIANGRIISISQPDLERIIIFEIEHLNELGDLCHKKLIVELMGKHSNLIFTDENDMIIDSIKHVSALVSSVREVLPGREYFVPHMQEKGSIYHLSYEDFNQRVLAKAMPLFKAIYNAYTGISPLIANELCYRASLDADASTSSLSDIEKKHLFHQFELLCEDVIDGVFMPNIVYDHQIPLEFSSLQLTQYEDLTNVSYESISQALENFYSSRDLHTRMRQKSSDLRKIVTTALERNKKKLQLQNRQMKDTEKREKFKVYGELINTYGYHLEEGAKKLICNNYYTNEEVTIRLDETLSPQENAQRYFEKYNKQKRTFEALTLLLKETQDEIDHLESILTSLDLATSEEDLAMIRDELYDSNYIHKKARSKQKSRKSKPLHYQTSDGYDVYVGKNNYQNDELTFHFANGGDWWFHAKGMPGSHVILRCPNGEEPSDTAYEEAAALAAYYSNGRDSQKVDIDYVIKKEVKKPNGSKPGFVVYYTNYSMTIAPNIQKLTLIK